MNHLKGTTSLFRMGLLGWALMACGLAFAQDNYEIQVYGAETVKPGNTMVEVHSNFTIDGSKALPGSRYTANGTFPTNHAQHETLELTQGLDALVGTRLLCFHQRKQRDGLPVGWGPSAAPGAGTG